MEKIEIKQSGAVLRLDRSEIRFLHQALNEILNGVGLGDSELSTRLGANRDELETLMREIGNVLDGPEIRALPAVLLAFLALSGCAGSKKPAEHCSQEQTQEWQYRPSWMVRPVSVSEAKEIVREEIGFDLDEPASEYEIQHYHQAWDRIIDSVNSGGQIWRVNAPPGSLGPSGLAVLKECKVVARMTLMES